MTLFKAHYITVALAATLLVASTSFAGSSSAKLVVTATVLPFVKFNATQHVTVYTVSSEDLQRGYIDLPNSLTVNVRTNLQSGVPVIVDNWGEGKVLVKESGAGNFSDSSFLLNTAGYRLNTQISKNFDTRIVLPTNMQVGVYPFTISMMPTI